MKFPKLPMTAVSAALCVLAATAGAHEYYTTSFKIIHPWAEPTEPGASMAPVYLKFEEVAADDRLIGARSDFAGKVELRSPLKKGVSAETTAPLEAIAVTAGSTTNLGPTGAHLLMLELKAPLLMGRSYPLTLIFERSGAIDTMLSVGAH